MSATTKTTKTEPTAAEAYAACRIDAACMMNVLQMKLDNHTAEANADLSLISARRMNMLQMKLDKHDAAQNADSKNWGHACDLYQFQRRLGVMIERERERNGPENVDSFLNDTE